MQASYESGRIQTLSESRVRNHNKRPVSESGEFVLYWCQAFRRLASNHALDRAISWARKLKRPLVVYEGLRLDYPWASRRTHAFLLDGMADNFAEAKRLGLTYFPFVETPDVPARGILRKLAARAALVVTDDYPQFIVPAQSRSFARRCEVLVEAVDGNSVIPLSLLGAPTAAAAHLRPKIHKLFAGAWTCRSQEMPDLEKLRARLDPPFPLWKPPKNLTEFLGTLPLDQAVPETSLRGGRQAALSALNTFVTQRLPRYDEERNLPRDPAEGAASCLSAYLRHGHLGIEEVVAAVLGPDWTAKELNLKTRNKDDFFCRDANVNSFLDEAITWRDVGQQWHFARNLSAQGEVATSQGPIPSFNFVSHDFAPSTDTLARVLPKWAWESLNLHAKDKREYLYTLEAFESGMTHDPLWNAAQRELVATGRIHNYLRMLWGKKVLEWSQSPEEGYRVLEHLNNKYALDGRDANSYTGIFWCFGLYDRPWPPERKVFGSIRFMSSDNTAKKYKLAPYYEYVRQLPTISNIQKGRNCT